MKIKFLFFFFFLFSLFLYQPPEVKAIVDCCPEGPGLCSTDVNYCKSHLLNCCYPSCPYTNWTNVPVSECQSSLGSPQNVCCTQSGGGCSSACGTLAQWGWCYAASCQVKANETKAGQCDYQYQYSYSKCGAVDSCLDTPYLEAGLCDASGCKVGGDYKTCCQGGSVVACTGGEFSGECPAGSSPVVNCVGPSCCTATPGPTPVPTAPPACAVDCSQWNGLANAGTCWANAGSGCQFCSGSNTCVCGDCPIGTPTPPPPPWQCVSPLWCDIPWQNLTCNDNQPDLFDEECKNRQTPRNEAYVCCSRQFAPAELYGYVTLNGSGRLGVNNIAPGKNNYDFLSPCSDYPGRHCGDSGSCGSDYIGNLGGLACSSSDGLPDTRVYYNGAEPVWQCKHEIKVCGSNACWDDWWFCRSGLSDGLSFRFAENYGLKASTDSVGLNYQFTATPPAGYTCGTWRLTGSTGTKTGTGCTATNGSMPLYDINSPTKNILVFDLLPVAEIKGNIYQNTANKSCNQGVLVSRAVTFLDGTNPMCTVFSVGGAYSTNNCTNGWRPVTGKTYGISVTRDDLTESCSSETNNCPVTSCATTVTAATLTTQNFTIFPWKNAWFQTIDGDIHGNSDIQSIIPAGCVSPNCKPVLSENGGGGTPGIVSTRGTISLGNDNLAAKVSDPKNWQVKSETTENLVGFGANATRYDYAYFSNKFSNMVSTDFSGGGKPTCPGGSSYCLYKSPAAVRLNGNWTLNATDKYIFLIDGDLTIDAGSVTVAEGGFLAFIVNGNIIVTKTLGVNNENSKAQKSLDGIFIADHFIDTTDDGSLSRTKTKRLNGSGMFIGYDGINLYRNISLDNNLNPSEYFVYRPDFLVNFPPAFGFNRLTWQEVAP